MSRVPLVKIVRGLLLVAGSAGLIAGCGGGSSGGASTTPTSLPPIPTATVTVTPSPTTATGSPSPSPTHPAASAADCTTGQLRLSLGMSQGATGSFYQNVVLTNTSSAPCTLLGFPGVSYVDSSGNQLGQAAVHNGSVGHRVTLAGGGSAYAVLQQPDPGVFSPPQCQEVTAARLKVFPPNQFGALLVHDHTHICTTARGESRITTEMVGTGG
jgi:hypothetical protein